MMIMGRRKISNDVTTHRLKSNGGRGVDKRLEAIVFLIWYARRRSTETNNRTSPMFTVVPT
jgi:hypothetical protein